MKRKILYTILLIIYVILFSAALIGCGGEKITGKYYEEKPDGTLDESSWIELIDKTKWKESGGFSGTYEINGNSIQLFLDEIEDEVFCDGTIENGVMVIEFFGTITYKKEASSVKNDTTEYDINETAKVKSIVGGTVSGLNVNIEVDETKNNIDLSGIITVSEGASWQLFSDISGQTLIPTKIAANLDSGDNVYYIVVTSSDNKINRTFTLNIYKGDASVNDKIEKIEMPSTYTRINADGQPASNGNYILFGKYPQTIKANNVTITQLADDRGNYLGSDGYYYAIIRATPYDYGYRFSTNVTISNGAVYYFRIEPIKWQIYNEVNGTALLLCESIIANKRFDDDSNNYKNSEIRTWLNNDFYNTAFTSMQKELINISNVDNSVYSTGYDNNPYVCANTNDRIFLPSYREMVSNNHGSAGNLAWIRKTSDYSRATGAYTNTGTSYYGNGEWWLRSPYVYLQDYSRNVYVDGYIKDYNKKVSEGRYGVVPALRLRLS